MTANRPNTSLVLAVFVSGVSAMSVAANGLRLASQDAFATARGEAFVATADNAAAVYYNPAGLTQLEGMNFRAGAYGIYLDPTFQQLPPNNTNTFHLNHRWAAVPQSFFAYTPRDWPVSFGLGMYAPFGGNVEWPQNTGFRTVATSGSLTYGTINPVVALKLAPGLSIAAGLMVNYADLDTEQGLNDSTSPFLANNFRFEGTGWGIGYNLGVLWQPQEKVSLGATFRSSTDITLKGHTEIEQQPFIPLTDQSAQTDFKFPLNAVLGISYRPTPKWNLEFNADYTDWSSFGKTTIHQASAPSPVQRNVTVTFDWQASWMYEFGVTRYFDKGWHVSGGYVFNQNSVPDTYYSPAVADLDRHFFSVGAGHRGRRVDFDVAYQFGYGPSRTVSGSTPPSIPGIFAGQNADGKYDFISHAVMVTVGLRF